MDFKDLKRLSVECEGWIRTAHLLIQDVMGEDFVFEDVSAGSKKGTDRAVSTDSKTTVAEVGLKLFGVRILTTSKAPLLFRA